MRIPGSSAAVSAIAAESLRLAVSAGNVANASTDGYRARRVVNEALPSGEVRARVGEAPEPSGAVLADDDGRDRVLSDVDVVSEVVVRISAQRALEASLAVLRTGDEMLQALIATKG